MVYTPSTRLTFFAMLPVTVAVVLMLRLRALLFFESMWFPNARRRVSLPVLVSLMRLAVPLWVFIFGILLTYSLLRCSGYDLPSLVSARVLRNLLDCL